MNTATVTRKKSRPKSSTASSEAVSPSRLVGALPAGSLRVGVSERLLLEGGEAGVSGILLPGGGELFAAVTGGEVGALLVVGGCGAAAVVVGGVVEMVGVPG